MPSVTPSATRRSLPTPRQNSRQEGHFGNATLKAGAGGGQLREPDHPVAGSSRGGESQRDVAGCTGLGRGECHGLLVGWIRGAFEQLDGCAIANQHEVHRRDLSGGAKVHEQSHARLELAEIRGSVDLRPPHRRQAAVDGAWRLRYVRIIVLAAVSYTHLRAHETGRNLVCRLLL